MRTTGWMTLLTAAALAAAPAPSRAAEPAPRPTQAVTVEAPGYDLLTAAFGPVNVGYDRAFASNSSWTAGLRYGSRSSARGTFTTDALLIGLTAGYRFWAESTALHGVYFSPIAILDYVSFKATESVTGASAAMSRGYFALGGMMGYQWMADSGVLFDMEMGLQNSFGHSATAPADLGRRFTGRIALGFAWD